MSVPECIMSPCKAFAKLSMVKTGVRCSAGGARRCPPCLGTPRAPLLPAPSRPSSPPSSWRRPRSSASPPTPTAWTRLIAGQTPWLLHSSHDTMLTSCTSAWLGPGTVKLQVHLYRFGCLCYPACIVVIAYACNSTGYTSSQSVCILACQKQLLPPCNDTQSLRRQ